jgi:hypothetical protein
MRDLPGYVGMCRHAYAKGRVSMAPNAVNYWILERL